MHLQGTENQPRLGRIQAAFAKRVLEPNCKCCKCKSPVAELHYKKMVMDTHWAEDGACIDDSD